MTGALKILRIEIDGHFHGSPDMPKPWVAQIDGVDAKYGLARTFVDRLNDYRGARRSISGRMNGVVAAFPLHEGKLYEVSRLRGRSSKRHVAREFLIVEGGAMRDLEPAEALAIADPHPGPAVDHVVPDGTRIARIDQIGTPTVCGFVVVDEQRLYRLRVGAIHEVSTATERYLVIADEHGSERITQAEAIARMSVAAAEAT